MNLRLVVVPVGIVMTVLALLIVSLVPIILVIGVMAVPLAVVVTIVVMAMLWLLLRVARHGCGGLMASCSDRLYQPRSQDIARVSVINGEN